MRKVWEARLQGGVRWWRRKAAAFERGAWVVGGEAGMEASGQAGEACRWRAALGWLGWAGDSAHLEMRRLVNSSSIGACEANLENL